MATRQETLLDKNERSGNKPYRFIIVTDTGGIVPAIVELEHAPDGWQDEITIKRSEKYKGLFRKYSTNELKFPKDGRDTLKNVYESKGITARSNLLVQHYNLETFTYDDHYLGAFDFSTYKIDELFVSIQVKDNEMPDRLKNLENVEVDLLSNKTINGNILPTLDNKFTSFDFPLTTISSKGNWTGRTIYSKGQMGATTESIRIQLDLNTSQIPNSEDQTQGIVDYFYRDAPEDTEGRAGFGASGTLTWDHVQIGTMDLIFTMKGASSGNQVIHAVTGLTGGSATFDFSNYLVGWFDITAGDNLYIDITFQAAGVSTPNTGYSIIMDAEQNFEIGYVTIGQQQSSGILYYEAFLRIIQKITEKTDSFYSEHFGRTDSTLTTYASDGPQSLGAVTTGQLIRGLDYTLPVTMPISFEKMFGAMDAIFNIGMGFEYIGGVGKIRIEEMAYFFDNNVVLDLSERVSEEEIGKEVLPEWAYAIVKTGYKKFENEIQNAIFEFNSKQEYATVIKSLSSRNNTLDIVSDFRADSNGINILRDKFQDEDSEDVKGDDEIFVVDLVRDLSVDFKARTSENFDEVSGLISAGNYFNLRYTPARNMIRHGSRIRAALERNLNTYLTFQAGDKIVSLTTRMDTEAEDVEEMSDILIDDLEEPMWHPEAYTCKAPLYTKDLRTIETNPYGIIKLGSTKFGWILEIKTNTDNEAEIKLLRVNLDYVTPLEVHP